MTFEEMPEEEWSQIPDILYATWLESVEERCLIKAQAVARFSEALSEDDQNSNSFEVLHRIAIRRTQYGVPFADHVIYNDIMVAALSDHCDRRQEARGFLSRYWIDNHGADLAIAEVQIVTSVDGLTIRDLEFISLR